MPELTWVNILAIILNIESTGLEVSFLTSYGINEPILKLIWTHHLSSTDLRIALCLMLDEVSRVDLTLFYTELVLRGCRWSKTNTKRSGSTKTKILKENNLFGIHIWFCPKPLIIKYDPSTSVRFFCFVLFCFFVLFFCFVFVFLFVFLF